MKFFLNIFKKILGLHDSRRKTKKIGRNEPCWCGSDKKYKHCHLENDKKKFKNPAPSSKHSLSPTHRRLLGMHDHDNL